MSSQFQPYLESICTAYERRSHFYTSTDAEDRKPFFDLMVQTAEEKTRDANGEVREREKVERLPVLKGLQKYASEHVLLVGRPGSGKSTALEQLLLVAVRQAQDNAALPIPVLVQLKADRSILPLIRETLRRHRLRLTEDEIDPLLFEGKLLLLLDGVNEMPKEALRQELQQFRDDNCNVPMVFTTRDLELGGTLGIEKKLTMQPLTAEQLKEFVGKYLPESGAEFLHRLNDRLKELAETPLLLKMLCEVFRSQGELPRSRGALFRTFDQQYEEIKGTLPVSADFRRFKSELLQHLAFGMLEGNALEPRLRLSRFEAEQRFEELLKGRVSAPGQMAKEWLEDLLEHHLLQVADDPKQIEFHHQLFLEYYAAEALLNRLDLLDDEQLKQEFLNFLKWTEPVALMLALVDEGQALRVVKLALVVDWGLGSRLAGAVKPGFQEQTIEWVSALTALDWLRIRLLGETKSEYAISSLLKLLEHSDFNVRWRAAEALGKIGSEKAIPGLLQLLEHPDSDIRGRAAETLGKIGSEKAIPGLLQRLEDADRDVRGRAAEALGKIGSEKAIPGLLQLLEHPDSYLRGRAAEVLGNIGSEKAIPGLLQLLEHLDSNVRGRAAEALGNIGSEKAIPGLLQLLEHLDSNVRGRAAEALGNIGSEAAIPGLLKLLEDLDSNVRWIAADVLGKIGSEVAILGLLKLLEESDSDVCWGATNGLFNLSARWIAAEALGNIGSEPAILGLLKLVKHGSPDVRWRAAEALGNIGSEAAIPDLLNLLEHSGNCYKHWKATEALGKIGSEAAIPGLLNLIKYADYDSEEHWRAEEALGNIDSEAAIPGLLNLLEESDQVLRSIAAKVLGKIGSKTAIPGLLKLLEESDDRYYYHWEAAEALDKIAKQHTDTIAPHLRRLHTLIPTDSGEYAYRVILAIQENCKYYNYEIYQAYLQAQKVDRPQSQNSDRSTPTINHYTIESVGIINTGTVHNKGDQIGEQHNHAEPKCD